MRRLLAFAAASTASLWASAALPCGGAFGADMHISPGQTIVVAHKAGTETYVFQPHFCGKAADFGLILPVPSALSASPSLAKADLYRQLEDISKPNHVAKTECRSRGDFGGGLDAGVGATDGPPSGTTVIDKGTVGIFDWVLLKADTPAAFTSWLDTNGYPHAPIADTQFAYYVAQGWHFVAFKVTASASTPKPDETICGDFGPVQLAFPTASPVIPTRIAAVSTPDSSPYAWRIFGISDQQLKVDTTEYSAVGKFSGALGAKELAANPDVAKLAGAGDRLVKIDVSFFPLSTTKDMTLTTTTASDYRETVYDITYVDCDGGTTPPVDSGLVGLAADGAKSGGGGCAFGGSSSRGALLVLSIAAGLGIARRRRR